MVKHAVILATVNPYHSSQLTYNRIHAMLPALGKPLVVRIMDRLYRTGIRQYTVIVGVNEGPVVSYLNEHWQPDVGITLKFKTEAESIASILRQTAAEHTEPFLLCSYNAFTHSRFPDSLIKHHDDFDHTPLLIGASNKMLSSAPHRYYAVMDGQRITEITSTPMRDQYCLALTNFAICGTEMINYLKNLPVDKFKDIHTQFLDLATDYIKSGGIGVMTETAWILQIDTDRDLLKLNHHLLEEGQDANILSELPYTVQVIPPVRIDPQVSVGQGATIGPHVYLERGCSVGRDVKIRESIILQKANVPAEKTIVDTIISTRGPISG